MRLFRHRIAGDLTTTHFIERPADLPAFRDWVEQPRPLVALDTETTGLDTHAPHFRLRTVQFGDSRDAWVLPVERSPELAEAARSAVARAAGGRGRRLAVHNAPFDWLVLDRHLGVPLETVAPRTLDTRILAHLLDPRGRAEGGLGHRLKDLSARWVDPAAPDTQDGLHAVFRSLGHTKETGWAAIAVDHPTYVLYAGLDAILTTRLAEVLAPLAETAGYRRLIEFEHQVARVCAAMERTGFLVDRTYAAGLAQRLAAEADTHTARAAGYGVDNVNSTGQIAAALTAMGEHLTETTSTGAPQVDKAVLAPLADLDRGWQRIGARTPNPLADAVLRAKRAGKWNTAYAEAFGQLADADDRIHPKINALQARTARMSISRPPVQQLPAGDSTIRRALIAEPGSLVCSVDFSAIELRVLAALAADPVMMAAIRDGEDLHNVTARLVYGPDFTPRHRKICKGVGFGKVYGGGADTIARQTGAPVDDIRRAMAAYDQAYRGIRRYSRRLQVRGDHGEQALITPSGRRLPLDRDRLYAATNYIVQSTARDIFALALLALDEAGLTPHLRLPVHDEVVFVAEADQARELCEQVQDLMTLPDWRGVPITTEAEVFTAAWTPDQTTARRTGDHPWQTFDLAA